MPGIHIKQLIERQRTFFNSGKTRQVDFRIDQLRALKSAIIRHERPLIEALRADMNKPELEAYAGEIALVLNEVKHAIRKIRSWARPKIVPTTLPLIPSRCSIYTQPFGVTLILSPWNYPFQLAVAPLVGAMAAGNCAIVKPSEISPNTSEVMARMINEHFNEDYVSVVTGDARVASDLLKERFDYIFFTGGSRVGRIVMEAASRHLTPLTLELGGKSPCIVDKSVQLDYTAKRIVWAKFFNAGQTCVAPDYVLADSAIKERLLERVKYWVRSFFGPDPSRSPDYARIINHNHFARLVELFQGAQIVIGGSLNEEDHYIAPTVIDNVSLDDALMQDEIFGPLLPIIAYETLSEAIDIVNARPTPLALYFFSSDKEKQERILKETSSGGVCINDAVVHFASHLLPFGGVGESGMGRYHGKASFDTFSHFRSVVKNTLKIDIPLRYLPYGRLKLALVKYLF